MPSTSTTETTESASDSDNRFRDSSIIFVVLRGFVGWRSIQKSKNLFLVLKYSNECFTTEIDDELSRANSLGLLNGGLCPNDSFYLIISNT